MEKTDRNETFYESLEKMEKGKNIRREWIILDFANYSFQTIPKMISSILGHALYKGTMFMSKEKLKTSLRMLSLKEKYEYRVRRSSKTRFNASCKHIGCKFQLHVVGMQGSILDCW